MSQICIIKNALDQTEQTTVNSENPFKVFLDIKAIHPKAKIYLGNPCPESDITPTSDNPESIERLINIKDDLTIVCYPGDAVVDFVMDTFNVLTFGLLDAAVDWLLDVPSPPGVGEQTGSSNNNLAAPENKQRIKARVPYILGRVKAIPDLYAPAYRHFVDGVEVEELLLCVSENPVQLSDFKEGDTPVQEITGKSVTAYGLGQNIAGTQNIYKVGDDFTEAPVIAKQSNSINGQTLIPPNATRIERSDVYFAYPNMVKVTGDAGDFDKFTTNENIIIEGANFGIADLSITGPATVNHTNNTISITSSQTVAGYQDYKKINITAMLITDPVNGQLDLAGLYNVSSITYSGGVYTITLLNPSSTNADFAKLTANANVNISANLTANTANIYLDGEYTVTNVDIPNKTITLATPSTINPDWLKLEELSSQQTPVAPVKLRGSQDNYIGWFTIDSPEATGMLFNFRAFSGIYQGGDAKTVNISVEYQRVINGTPSGTIYNASTSMTGRGNNRDSIGTSLWVNLPTAGAYRFRARRTNDNGDAANLSDETKFYQAYAFHRLVKLVYDNRVLVRTRTIATVNATSRESRQLNCIAESLVYTYVGGVKSASRVPSRNMADLTIDLALHPKIGRRSVSEIDFDRIYQTRDEIVEYFGSEKMAEFNYTLDNSNTSFEEMMRMIAMATCSHDRRVSRKIYYDLESAVNEPIILFNHRNKRPQTEVREYTPRNIYDGVELTYVDSENGWVEKTLKVPNDFITNPKKVEGKGIVYHEQAHILAWRNWNKLLFSRVGAKFTAYGESDLVFRGDCVLNTDDTRLDDGSSGEVLVWNGLTVRVSQPYVLDADLAHVIHLQLKSGAIDAMYVTQGADEYEFILQRTPAEPLITTGQVKTTYSITTESRKNEQKFLVSTKRPNELFENELSLINFDDRFYRNDKDILNNVV